MDRAVTFIVRRSYAPIAEPAIRVHPHGRQFACVRTEQVSRCVCWVHTVGVPVKVAMLIVALVLLGSFLAGWMLLHTYPARDDVLFMHVSNSTWKESPSTKDFENHQLNLLNGTSLPTSLSLVSEVRGVLAAPRELAITVLDSTLKMDRACFYVDDLLQACVTCGDGGIVDHDGKRVATLKASLPSIPWYSVSTRWFSTTGEQIGSASETRGPRWIARSTGTARRAISTLSKFF